MIRRPPRSTRTGTLCPYTTLFRSLSGERPMPDDVKIKLPDYEKSGVNMCPGHGTGGRKPTNAALKQLAGHGDPGMFGSMFAPLPPLDVPASNLPALAAAMPHPSPDERTAGHRTPTPPYPTPG